MLLDITLSQTKNTPTTPSEEQPRPSSSLVNVPVEEWMPLEQALNPDLLSDLVVVQGLERQG
jgi:hypothetical protein